jgi:hypothetical protein
MINLNYIKKEWKRIFSTYGVSTTILSFIVAFFVLTFTSFAFIGTWLGIIYLTAKYMGEYVAGVIIILPGVMKILDWTIKLFEKLSDKVDNSNLFSSNEHSSNTFGFDYNQERKRDK